MKNILITLYLASLSAAAMAQGLPKEKLNQTMARYYEGCLLLREGIEQKNSEKVDEACSCLDECKSHVDRLELARLQLQPVEVEDTVPMKGHVYFNGAYAACVYNQLESQYQDRVEALRGAEAGDEENPCSVCHVALKAKGKVRYALAVGGECQMFTVAEPGGRVALSVACEGSGETKEGEAYEGGGVSYVEWTQPEGSGLAYITLENLSDREISVAVASN